MKEFIEKLIGRLEEELGKVNFEKTTQEVNEPFHDGLAYAYGYSISIVNQLAEEYNNANDSMEIQIAKNYAKCLVKYGVDIREKWETATSQSMALEQAYLRGRQDERDRFAEWQEEYAKDINVSTIDAGELFGNGWIACGEKLPEDCTIYEVTAQFGNGMCYTEFAYYDESKGEWWKHDDDGIVNVLAWKEHSTPYQPKEQ